MRPSAIVLEASQELFPVRSTADKPLGVGYPSGAHRTGSPASNDEQQSLLDLATETSVEGGFSMVPAFPVTRSPDLAAPPRTIVLTGVAGFIG